MKRWCVLLFGVVSYVLFLGVFLYAMGFVGNFGVPRTMDGPRSGSLWMAAGGNLLLIALFALQHSVMARPWFKRGIFVPPLDGSGLRGGH